MKTNFSLYSEWLYFKVYCGSKTAATVREIRGRGLPGTGYRTVYPAVLFHTLQRCVFPFPERMPQAFIKPCFLSGHAGHADTLRYRAGSLRISTPENPDLCFINDSRDVPRFTDVLRPEVLYFAATTSTRTRLLLTVIFTLKMIAAMKKRGLLHCSVGSAMNRAIL